MSRDNNDWFDSFLHGAILGSFAGDLVNSFKKKKRAKKIIEESEED